MKKTWAFLWFFLFISAASAVDWEIPNNTMKFGDSSSAFDKSIFFRMGDGVGDPELKVNNTTKDFTFNNSVTVQGALTSTGPGVFGGSITTTSTQLNLGDGADLDNEINIDLGLGLSLNPKLKYDSAQDAWVFRNEDGVEKKIGAETLAEGESNPNVLINPEFESGLSDWIASGGSFALDSVTPGFGANSADWDASGIGQTLTSTPSVTISGGLKGLPCRASAFYQTIETSTAWDLKVLVGSSTVLATKELSIPTSTSLWASDGVDFDCPEAGDISIVFESTVADPLNIKLDKVFLGSNTKPFDAASYVPRGTRIVSCDFDLSASGSFPKDATGLCDWVTVSNRAAQGRVFQTIKDGTFSKPPVCTCTPYCGSDCSCAIDGSPTSTSFVSTTFLSSTGGLVDIHYSLKCEGVK